MKYIVYGAGTEFREKYDEKFVEKIDGVVDDCIELQGTKVRGKLVQCPTREILEGAFVFISAIQQYEKIKEKLIRLGFDEETEFVSGALFYGNKYIPSAYAMTSVEHHGKQNSYDDSEKTRNEKNRIEQIGRLIRETTERVIDLGSGEVKLKNVLRKGVQYYSLDFLEKYEKMTSCDFGKNIFPGIYGDCIVCSGVLEYIKNLDRLIGDICTHCQYTIISYRPRIDFVNLQRRYEEDFQNWLSVDELKQLFLNNGFEFVLQQDTTNPYQYIFVFQRIKRVYLLLTPSYASMGDQAIVYAEKEYLENKYKDYRLEILNEEESVAQIKKIALCHNMEDLFFVQGGGNMGSLYPEVEKRRRYVLSILKNKRVVIFPQSIFYLEDEWKESVPYYSNPFYVICARERESYQLMKEYYPDANVMLVPDIVYTLWNRFQFKGEKRNKILVSLRQDKECANLQFNELLKSNMRLKFEHVKELKMYGKGIITNQNRTEYVENAICSFASAKVVITDRLHGCIFAAITNTPCIVLPNRYHKLKGNYDWLKSYKFIRYMEDLNIEKIIQCVFELLELEETEHNMFIERRKYEKFDLYQ